MYTDYLLTQAEKRKGPNALLILGPHTPTEASSVLNLVRFYKKLMVRNRYPRQLQKGEFKYLSML